MEFRELARKYDAGASVRLVREPRPDEVLGIAPGPRAGTGGP